ncbi:MAG TPA: tetratricopeptide repeat protein, partial [Candidatus Cloacimonadota bacterium]|nr:tetratricopeptide repeat protein [Candidatus Cloacimonadota bacterium]
MRVISLTSKTVLSLLLLIFAASLLAQTEADLQTEYAQKLAYKKQVYERILQFISENPDSPNLADLYFNVAELSTEVEVFQPEKTVSYYQKVLEYDPNFLQKDVVLHNIGYFGYKAETSKRDAGRIAQIELVMNWPDSLRLSEYKLQYVISAYRQILEELPQSPYNTDAAYRLGRIYFDLAIDARVAEKYFNQAIGYFDIVAKRDGDPLQYYGLFQRGWTYFASTRFTAAIADFSTILNILGNSAQADKRTFFEADAIENIAFSLIEYDGTDFVGYSQAAAQAKEILRSCVEDDYGRQILIQAVKLKKEYNAPMQAVDLYESYLMLYPASKNSPCIVDSILAIYRQYPKRIRGERSAEEMIIAGMEKLVTDFNVGSAWYENNQDLDISNELQIIGNAYAFLEPKYLNNFLRTRSSEDFRKYEAMVVNYCAFGEFSDEESRERKQRLRNNLVDLSQDLAEITEDPAHYLATIAEIDNYIAGQSSSAELYHYYELKFYNYEKLYDLLDPVIDQHPFTDGERTIDRARLDSLFIATATEYENFLLKYKLTDDKVGDQLVRVLYRKAELYNESGDADSARDNYLQLLSYELGDELKMITYSRLAEISQAQKDFDKAEYYYREASKFAVDGSKSDFENNLLATVLARAKAYEDASNFREAARQYLKIAAELETSKPDESVNFLLKAIDNYLKG